MNVSYLFCLMLKKNQTTKQKQPNKITIKISHFWYKSNQNVSYHFSVVCFEFFS